ncbi:MAG: hypothetical protein ACOYXT_11490 [Bacteroidota bacterium]
MQRLLITLTVLFSIHSLRAQDIPELEKRNGFKDIKLGMVVDSVKGIKLKKEFKERGEFPAKLYEVEHPDYQKIGEVEISKVELKAYKDLIYQITVVADKDTRLMKALESIYGQAEYDIKHETYFWKSKNLVLKFRSHTKHHLEMSYISYPVLNQMREDKGKKVQNIAEDF